MDISKEYIEQLIFEYHEGNLSDSQKSDLLNLIHQHPEYETDFALWAQTYAHVESAVPNYGLAAGLLQKPVVAWYAHTWVQVSASALLVGGSIFGYLILTKNDVKQMKTEVSAPANISTTNELNTTFTIPTKPNTTNYNHSAISKAKRVNKQAEVITITNSQTPMEVSSSQENSIAGRENQLQLVQEQVVVVKPDTLVKVEIIDSKSRIEEKTQKKQKRKLPLNLKPSSEFIPVNPNF